MMLARRACALVSCSVLALTLLVASPQAAGASASASPPPGHRAQVLLDWERIVFRTVYTDGATPIPVGVPILGFTSVAMHRAVKASRHRHHSSEVAALVTAAHDVLVHYYPAAAPKLDADEAASLADVRDGRAERRGIRIGERVATKLLASRVGDHYLDPTIHYSKAPAPGIWQPTPPATDMLAAWLGSLTHLVAFRRVRVSGPDALTSRAYTRDFREVKRLGSIDSTARTDRQTDTALFYNSNSATMVGDALIRKLEKQPIGLARTARLFARIHAAMTDSLIRCWELKRDVGFWRPSQAIVGADTDLNPATTPDPAWTPLVPNPNYSDYVSGHGCLTSPAVEVIRHTLGARTRLELISVNSPTPRILRLARIERQALNARVWAGLHFRDAVADAYTLGHRTARLVIRRLH